MLPTQNPTARQQQVLDFIKGYMDERGYSPSYREISSIGITPGTVRNHLDALEAKGYLVRNMNEARSIQLKGNK